MCSYSIGTHNSQLQKVFCKKKDYIRAMGGNSIWNEKKNMQVDFSLESLSKDEWHDYECSNQAYDKMLYTL